MLSFNWDGMVFVKDFVDIFVKIVNPEDFLNYLS